MQPPSIQQPKKSNLKASDQEFDESVNEFIDAVLEQEKKEFMPGVESFSVHADKIRQQVTDEMREFQRKYSNGFQLLCEALEKKGIKRPVVSEEKLAIFDDQRQFTEALGSGVAIYQLLGFTPDLMLHFYEAASEFTENGEYEKGRDAFYFLATISPEFADFWLGLGICYAQLKESDSALNATLLAIELDPAKSDAYLNALHLYLAQKDIEKANQLCQQGINHALEHIEEAWAQELRTTLEEANRYINS